MEDCKFGGSLWKKLSHIWNEGCKTSPRLCSQVKCGALRTAVVLFFQGKSPSVSPCSFSPVFFVLQFFLYVFFSHLRLPWMNIYIIPFFPHHLWQVCVHKDSHYHVCLITPVLMHFVTRICDSRLRLEAVVVRGCKWPQIKRLKSHFGGAELPLKSASLYFYMCRSGTNCARVLCAAAVISGFWIVLQENSTCNHNQSVQMSSRTVGSTSR